LRWPESFICPAIELNNNGTLIAPAESFDKCFNPKVINRQKHLYCFETEGIVVNTKIRNRN